MSPGIVITVEPEPSSAVFGDAYRAALRPETFLLQEIIELSKKVESAACRAFALNPTDLLALCQIMMGGPLSPTGLARSLRLSTAAVTTVVDRLEATGHVTRSQHPTDGRAVLVVPTSGSIDRAFETLLPVATAIDAALEEFDGRERAIISRYLEAVAARQRAALE
ncbi:MAG: MarR family transcriptional regulator [Rhodoglobus sp.]|nr:MarR family transcriptional regulator [Rhodoglobus sp.]